MAVEISPCEVEINEMELTEDKVCLKIKLKIKCCRIKFYFLSFLHFFILLQESVKIQVQVNYFILVK